MRTTLTLDEDVATLLQKEVRRSGEPLKQTVNRLLRAGLEQASKPAKPKRFRVTPLPMSFPDFTKAEELLDLLEGPLRR